MQYLWAQTKILQLLESNSKINWPMIKRETNETCMLIYFSGWTLISSNMLVYEKITALDTLHDWKQRNYLAESVSASKFYQ